MLTLPWFLNEGCFSSVTSYRPSVSIGSRLLRYAHSTATASHGPGKQCGSPLLIWLTGVLIPFLVSCAALELWFAYLLPPSSCLFFLTFNSVFKGLFFFLGDLPYSLDRMGTLGGGGVSGLFGPEAPLFIAIMYLIVATLALPWARLDAAVCLPLYNRLSFLTKKVVFAGTMPQG